MALFEWLDHIDTRLFLAINEANSAFFDRFFSLFTNKEIWYPLYLLLIFLILQKYRIKGLWVVLFFVIMVVISDQLSGLIKDLVHRYRPSHESSLVGKVNLPAGAGGLYGFLSSHAANSFALAMLIGFLSRSKRLWTAFLLWALLTCYSRIYVGVHYPFDVVAGAVMGALIGWGMFVLLRLFDDHFQRKRIYNEGRWKSKYSRVLLIAMLFTVTTLLIVAKLTGKAV